MDQEYNNYWRRSHVPPFGSWEYCQNDAVDDLPFTQCFETARQQPTGVSFPIYTTTHSKDRDLYSGAGEVYKEAVIVLPRHSHRGKGRYGYEKERHKRKEERWVECDAVKVAAAPAMVVPRKIPKAVDEDLYKISPELLYAKPKKKRMGVLSRCLFPNCASS